MLRTFVLVLCLAVVPAYAQQAASSQDRAEQARERIAQLQSRLKLTPEQVERLKPIIQQEVQELRAVRDKYASEASRRAKVSMAREMKGIQQKYEGSVAAILTPEQAREWNEIKQERKQEMKQKRGR
jgi:Spy/CpxP family protein refolding chaperone